ncbi:unnamed protein product [Symbiodinium sp. CCMP2592]|nr:unnamed protein product [Symbiodinium sp. CCMP2592]
MDVDAEGTIAQLKGKGKPRGKGKDAGKHGKGKNDKGKGRGGGNMSVAVEDAHPPANSSADSPATAASANSPAKSVKSIRIDLSGDLAGAVSGFVSRVVLCGCAVYNMSASDHDGRWTLVPGPEPDPEVHVPLDGRVWAVNSPRGLVDASGNAMHTRGVRHVLCGRAISDPLEEPGVVQVSGLLDRHIDLGLYAPHEGSAYRTTLLRQGADWVLLELSEPLASLETPNELLHPSGEQFDLIVFGHREKIGAEELGFTMQESPAGLGDMELSPPGPQVTALMMHWLRVQTQVSLKMHWLRLQAQVSPCNQSSANPPGSAQADAVMMEALADEPSALPESITINDVVLTPTTTLSTLRAACTSLGVGKVGRVLLCFGGWLID